MSTDAESFSWDSGLTDDVDFTVNQARFTYNSKIKDGEVLVLALTGPTRNEAGEIDELEQFYACGEGWEPADGGSVARREDGRSKLFNARSSIVEFINAAMGCGVTMGEIVAKGGPTSVNWVLGRTFHMKQKEFSGTFDGEKKTWFKLLPDKVVKKKVGAEKAAEKPAPTEAPGATEALSSEGDGVSPALKAKLTALAKTVPTHDAFIDAAFSQFEAEVSGNAAAEALVVDAAFYNEAA